jgi:cyclopropane-fatty-acyl-phospholipid synthase
VSDAISAPDRPGWGANAAGRPASASTTAIDRWVAARLQDWLAPAAIRVQLWNGWSPAARLQPEAVGTVVFTDRGALVKVTLEPDLQFGEMYMAGRADVCGPLVDVLAALGRLPDSERLSLRDRLALAWPRANDLLTARRNVHHHYDLGNDFYALWLDREMAYTCAYFPTERATLEEAQIAKFDLVCRKLRLRAGERVIEAGCGWGALALHMAREYGVVVKAFNISTEQIRHARERAEHEGLADRVEFIEDDYRNVAGQFDAFVSVGMLEHVGATHYPSLASVVRRVLPAHGRGLLHFIGRDAPRPLNAWIRHRIFPGAYPPALTEVGDLVLRPAGMDVHHIENLRPHYARTLDHWRQRYEAARPRVEQQFGSAFARAWHLYLAGSQAGFITGSLQLYQVVFAPPASDQMFGVVDRGRIRVGSLHPHALG